MGIHDIARELAQVTGYSVAESSRKLRRMKEREPQHYRTIRDHYAKKMTEEKRSYAES